MFKGFDDSASLTPVPDAFFRALLPRVDDLDELKVTLYVLWRVEHTEGASHHVSRDEIAADRGFMQGMDAAALDAGLEKAVRRGSLLRVEGEPGGLFFLNSPRGRAAVEALRKGQRSAAAHSPTAPHEHPNIFKLYEENIGPLTPLIADALKDAENTYPETLIVEAFSEAVARNKRSWKYVEAILKRWKEEGRAEKQDRRDSTESHQRSIERKIEELRRRSS